LNCKEEWITFLLDVADQLQSSSPSSKYSSSNNKKENTRNFRKRKNLKKTLSFSRWPLLSVALQGYL